MPGSSCGRSSTMPAKTGAAAASWHARNIFCIIMPDSASRIWAFPSQNTAGPSGMTWFWSFLLLLYKSIGSVIVCGCFISTVQWEYSFFPVFPLAESMAEAFFWLFLWIFKEKSIDHFLWQIQSIFSKGCVRFYGWWFFQWKSIDKSSFHIWRCGPLSFFVHYMKSSFEELLRDLQIISKELFLSSWNLVSTTNLNTAFQNALP